MRFITLNVLWIKNIASKYTKRLYIN